MKGQGSSVRFMSVLLLAASLGVAPLSAQVAPKPKIQQKSQQPSQTGGSLPEKQQSEGGLQAATAEMDSTRSVFNEYLARHPRLRDVIVRDPSLLMSREYMNTNAPELWDFLEKHPEVARNPEFFVVSFDRGGDDPVLMRIMGDVWPFLVFVIITSALLWILRTVLENRRWSKIAKVQAEAHTKLLERFASSQELLAYMETEAGRRFLESAPIPVELEQKARLSAPLGRILWSVQLAFILALVGVGLLSMRARIPGAEQPLLVLGTLGVTLGGGFFLSAAAAYMLSRHLGLLPDILAVGGPHEGSPHGTN